MYAYPRLSHADAVRIFSGYRGLSVDEVASAADATLESVQYGMAPTGAKPVSFVKLKELREHLRELARAASFPASPRQAAQRTFEIEVAKMLRSELEIIPGEALRNDVWQFLSCALAPDLVLWRWRKEDGETISEDRFLGGNRNMFGRLWRRATTFYDDRLQNPHLLIESLGEDNFTAILERTSFARHEALCREVARAFLLRAEYAREVVQDQESVSEQLLRQTMLRLTRLSGFIAFFSLEDSEQRDLVAQAFDETLLAMGATPRPENELVADRPELRLQRATRAEDEGSATLKVPTKLVARCDESDEVTSPGRPVPPKDTTDFFELDADARTEAVWHAVLGKGQAPEADLVRIAAEQLRAAGIASYERLREGGVLYRSLRDAIQRGVSRGLFDIPARGYRRAICQDLDQLPDTVWKEQFLALARTAPLPREDLIREASKNLKQLVEIPAYRTGGSVHTRAEQVLTKALGCGVLREKQGKVMLGR